MNELLATQIRLEIGRAQTQKAQLDRYIATLNETLSVMDSLKNSSVSVIDRNRIPRHSSADGKTTEIAPAAAADLDDRELYQPRPVPGLTSGPVNLKEQPNTLEMAKMVLKNAAGEPKSVDELRRLIRTTYGIEPAKSLDQMLYKRSSAGRGFYKTPEGKFGLSELRTGVTIDSVEVGPSAVV